MVYCAATGSQYQVYMKLCLIPLWRRPHELGVDQAKHKNAGRWEGAKPWLSD
jgi:hypothetical protein